MSKAEELAKEYAEKFILTVDHQGDVKEAYIDGYHQAEKDLELTWEDMHTIAIIEDKLIHELCLDDQTLPQTKEFYQEVLKRFKERKGE